jgi:protein tyrosine phosphatase (PTP) superfamily phosphohydrolase (DUF442 family)
MKRLPFRLNSLEDCAAPPGPTRWPPNLRAAWKAGATAYVIGACGALAALPAWGAGPVAASAPAASASAPAAPPNLVPINPHLVTSGQPSAEWLETLKAQGFAADIYLVPATAPDAVASEPLIVSRQGLVFVNIPIAFDGPTAGDFQTFAGVLQALGTRKVLVHCQVNFRASSMVFLYRTIVQQEDPQVAYDALSRVWTPEGAWKRLIESQLQQHKIDFELY